MWDFLDNGYGDGVIISIGLLLPEDQADEALSLSRRICGQEECVFQIQTDKNPARVRLYETIIPEYELSAAQERIARICYQMPTFEMSWGETESTEHFIALWGESNETLDLFHRGVLDAINPLRHGYHKHKYDVQTIISSQEQDNIDRWGSAWADPYVPHMILAKARVRFAQGPLDFSWPFAKCTFTGVLFGIKKQHGALESLHEFPFLHSPSSFSPVDTKEYRPQ